MSNSTTFISQQTVVGAAWLNDVNTAVFTALGDGSTNPPTTPAQVISNLGVLTAAVAAATYTTPATVATGYTAKTGANGSAVLPAGTTAQRDGTPAIGYTRANLDLSRMEWWNGTAWADMAAATPFLDTNALIKGSVDATKLMRFEVDGLTTATTRIVTIQDKNYTAAGLDDINGGSQLGAKIQPITASVAANALTITLNPTSLDFRSATLGSGAVNTRTIASAISTVISSGSTGGTVNAIQSRIYVIAMDNAGTVELGWTNSAGGTNLDETGLITTVAEGGAGAADSATVVYSVTARTSVPYRVVGYVESTQATAGTWATAPSTIQGIGGQALAAMSSIGYGQTWQNVLASRALSTTYYNTTGKPIECNVCVGYGANTLNVVVDGITVVTWLSAAAYTHGTFMFIVPPSKSYIVTSAQPITVWAELR